MQNALSRSPCYVSLGIMHYRTSGDIIQGAMDFSPEQIAGPGRAALKRCGDIRKVLNAACKLKCERNSLKILDTEAKDAYVKLESGAIFAKLISAVSHQSDKRLQCMGISEAIREFSAIEKKSEGSQTIAAGLEAHFLRALC